MVRGEEMKKLLTVLLILGSFCAFAQNIDADKELNDFNKRLSDFKKELAISAVESCAYSKYLYKIKREVTLDCHDHLLKASRKGISDEEIREAIISGIKKAKRKITKDQDEKEKERSYRENNERKTEELKHLYENILEEIELEDLSYDGDRNEKLIDKLKKNEEQFRRNIEIITEGK